MDLRGHLDLMLLATLRDDGPAHGYAIIASLRERSLGAFASPGRDAETAAPCGVSGSLTVEACGACLGGVWSPRPQLRC